MISIRKHLERLSGEQDLRNAFLDLVKSVVAVAQKKSPVADSEDHAWFSSSLDSLQQRLVENPSPGNIEVVAALLAKTLEDHWTRLSRQFDNREQELKRIVNLLAEGAARLDGQHRGFYTELRESVQKFEDISQIEDITYLRKKLTEQVTHMQETVHRQEGASHQGLQNLQEELAEAHRQIAALKEVVHIDSLTRLPGRRAAEKFIAEHVERVEPFVIAIVVIERLEQINLRYGMDAGDEIVRRFAKELRERVPERMALTRWGGPAFVSVVTQSPVNEVRASIQKIVAEIASQPIELEAKGARLIRMTSRVAVHEWLSGETFDKIIRLVEVFCATPKPEASEAGGARASS